MCILLTQLMASQLTAHAMYKIQIPKYYVSLKLVENCTQGLIQTQGSMVIFDENQGVSDLSKYEFHCPIYVKIIKFVVI